LRGRDRVGGSASARHKTLGAACRRPPSPSLPRKGGGG
jgi:hypothetical protein